VSIDRVHYMAEHPHLATHVRHLEISSLSTTKYDTTLSWMADVFFNVDRVVVENLYCPGEIAFPCFALRFPALVTLDIRLDHCEPLDGPLSAEWRCIRLTDLSFSDHYPFMSPALAMLAEGPTARSLTRLELGIKDFDGMISASAMLSDFAALQALKVTIDLGYSHGLDVANMLENAGQHPQQYEGAHYKL
jgi:hypothetical protein